MHVHVLMNVGVGVTYRCPSCPETERTTHTDVNASTALFAGPVVLDYATLRASGHVAGCASRSPGLLGLARHSLVVMKRERERKVTGKWQWTGIDGNQGEGKGGEREVVSVK